MKHSNLRFLIVSFITIGLLSIENSPSIFVRAEEEEATENTQ
jgi:hypothetical protein